MSPNYYLGPSGSCLDVHEHDRCLPSHLNYPTPAKVADKDGKKCIRSGISRRDGSAAFQRRQALSTHLKHGSGVLFVGLSRTITLAFCG